jgi:hypothetical protein
MTRARVIVFVIALTVTHAVAAAGGWLAGLPRLYHDGVNSDDLGMMALSRCLPVLDAAAWRLLTCTTEPSKLAR